MPGVNIKVTGKQRTFCITTRRLNDKKPISTTTLNAIHRSKFVALHAQLVKSVYIAWKKSQMGHTPLPYLSSFQHIDEDGEIDEENEGVVITKAPTYIDVHIVPPRRGIRSIYREVERVQCSSSTENSDITDTGNVQSINM